MSEMPGPALRGMLRTTKALADGQRLRILLMLRAGELCVCQIVETLGLAASTVSKHLSILTGADLLVARKDSRWVYYRIANHNRQARTVVDWLAAEAGDDPVIQRDCATLRTVADCPPTDLCRDQRQRKTRPRGRRASE
jgi:DNA-binding transcriptional ArsR family regulator